ncbi:response regulator transcription factor [soil metagenome]
MSGRVLIIEEHALVALGLQLALSGRCWDVQTVSGSASDVIAHAERFQPQFVFLDVHLGTEMGSGPDLAGPLSSRGAHVIMLTAEKRRTVLAECVEAGAAGWIRKSATLDEVDATLRHLLTGGTVIGRAERASLLDELRLERMAASRARARFERLTQRECRVLGALIEGMSAEEIAMAQFVALTTVRSQIRAVLQKLGVRTQLAAVALANAHPDLLPHPGPAAPDRRRPTRPSLRVCASHTMASPQSLSA